MNILIQFDSNVSYHSSSIAGMVDVFFRIEAGTGAVFDSCQFRILFIAICLCLAVICFVFILIAAVIVCLFVCLFVLLLLLLLTLTPVLSFFLCL